MPKEESVSSSVPEIDHMKRGSDEATDPHTAPWHKHKRVKIEISESHSLRLGHLVVVRTIPKAVASIGTLTWHRRDGDEIAIADVRLLIMDGDSGDRTAIADVRLVLIMDGDRAPFACFSFV